MTPKKSGDLTTMSPDDLIASVDELRTQREALIAHRQEIELAPVPAPEAAARLERMIAELASSVTLDIGNLRSPIRRGTRARLFSMSVPHHVQLDVLDLASGIVASIAPGAIREAFKPALAVAEGEAPGGLALMDRPAALAEIDAKLQENGRAEERATVELWTRHVPLDRRQDVDPTCVFGLKPPAPHPQAPPETLAAHRQAVAAWTAEARAKLKTIDEHAHQLHVVATDLADRRREAYTAMQRCEQDLERARVAAGLRPHETDPATIKKFSAAIPSSFEENLTEVKAEFTRIDAEARRASDAWKSAARCLPALREPLGLTGPQVRAA